jgi:hypothetical protein
MTSRKDFLVAGAVAAATMPALADAATPTPAASATPAPPPVTWPAFQFDLAAFNAQLDGPQKHKNLFSSVAIENGTIFGMIRGTLDAYKDLGVPAAQVLPAAVLYHGMAVAMGYDDYVWNTYVIPMTQRPPNEPGAKVLVDDALSVLKPGVKGNPFLTGGDTSIPALVRDSGLRIYLCNQFTRGFSMLAARINGTKPIDVYNDVAAHLVPSAMLTPTGVWAVHAVQEHQFTLLPSNVLRTA